MSSVKSCHFRASEMASSQCAVNLTLELSTFLVDGILICPLRVVVFKPLSRSFLRREIHPDIAPRINAAQKKQLVNMDR